MEPHRGGVPVPSAKVKAKCLCLCCSDCTIPGPTEGSQDPEEVVAEAHHQRPQQRRQCGRKAAQKIQLYLTNFSLPLLLLRPAFWGPERRAVNHMDTIKWKGTSNGNRQHASIVRAV